MNKNAARIDLVKLALYLLKRCWLIILCAAIGFGVMYYRASKRPDTYTASGTMFIINGNPNLINYGYTNTSDMNSAVQLINTYSVVVKSELVLDRILEYEVEKTDGEGNAAGKQLLVQKYPGLTASAIASSISMSSVNDTGMVRVSCTTRDPQQSADICNAVLLVAPEAIKQVVGAGQAEIVDSARVPLLANPRGETRQGLTGALAGAVAAAALLALLFLLNQRVTESSELTDNYTLPILSQIRREKQKNEDPGAFLLNKKSPMETVESYAKLRMNLLYTLVDKKNNIVEVTSAISGEGKSTITANMGIACALSGRRVLLIDADMRRACQRDVFHYKEHLPGLSNVLIGGAKWQDVVLETQQELLWVMPAGHLPPNPSELLESRNMHELLQELSQAYDLVLLDAPPINIVSDPLALSSEVAGSIFVVRQDFSTHREIRKALTAAEMTGMEILGFVFYGENLKQGSYYSRRYYKSYYHKYDSRGHAHDSTPGEHIGNKTAEETTHDVRRDNDHEDAQQAEAADASSADADHVRHRRSRE